MSGPRRIDFDEYVVVHKAASRRIWLEAEAARRGAHRNVRRRPRSPEECEILTRLARARLARALSSGELVVVGPRRYRLRVF